MKYKIIHIICSFKRQNVQSLFEFLESTACRGSETAFTPLLLSATEHTPTFFFIFYKLGLKRKAFLRSPRAMGWVGAVLQVCLELHGEEAVTPLAFSCVLELNRDS